MAATTKAAFTKFLMNAFKNDPHPESLTSEVLQEMYLEHAELEEFTKAQKGVFVKAIDRISKELKKEQAKSEKNNSSDIDSKDKTPVKLKKAHLTSDEDNDSLTMAKPQRNDFAESGSDSDDEPLIRSKKGGKSSSQLNKNIKRNTPLRQKLQKDVVSSPGKKFTPKEKTLSKSRRKQDLVKDTDDSELESSHDSCKDIPEREQCDHEMEDVNNSSDDEPLSGMAQKTVTDLELSVQKNKEMNKNYSEGDYQKETDQSDLQLKMSYSEDENEKEPGSGGGDKFAEDSSMEYATHSPSKTSDQHVEDSENGADDHPSHQDTAKKKLLEDSNDSDHVSADENQSKKSDLSEHSDHSDAAESKHTTSKKLKEESMESSEDESLAKVKAGMGKEHISSEGESSDESHSYVVGGKRKKGQKQSSKNGKRARRKSKTREEGSSSKTEGGSEDRRIIRMKRYLRLVGLKVQYSKVLKGCNSIKSQINKLQELLEEAGLQGTPTIAKCKKLRKKRLVLKEVAELDRNNILDKTEGRALRRNRTPSQNRSLTPPVPEKSPTEVVPVTKQLFSKLKGIVDSEESESN